MESELQKIYNDTKQLSIKYDTYFPVYEELLARYRGKKITIVEVGIFNGGSLFMWRKYFGPEARIIGIDLNPIAKDWERDGFEIFIGDQSSPEFWEKFYQEVGSIDILVDDGGHTNDQQIITSHFAIQNIKDGGVLIVEDVHTSYFRGFGNPFKYSFINFASHIVTSINSRASALKRANGNYWSIVYSAGFYESIVAFHIDRQKCKIGLPVSNNGLTKNAEDFRYHGSFQDLIFKLTKTFSGTSLFSRGIVYTLNNIQFLFSRISYFSYRKYFKKM
jgi:hypothetical protein